MLFRRIVPGENIPETDLKEMNTMLAERVTQWADAILDAKKLEDVFAQN